MLLLLVELCRADEHREVGIFNVLGADEVVKVALNLLPDEIGPGTKDVAAGHLIVLDELGFRDYLLVPLGEVLGLLNGNGQLLLILFLRLFLLLQLGLGLAF